MADAVLRCLKKGKGDEQALSARCITVLCIQLGSEAEELMNDCRPALLAVLTDGSAPLKARGEVSLLPHYLSLLMASHCLCFTLSQSLYNSCHSANRWF